MITIGGADLPEAASLADLACLAQVLSSPTRLKILRLVQVEELCVCELAAILGVTQPAISQHLAKLREAGLVVERRSGQMALYRSADIHERVLQALRRLTDEPLTDEVLEGHGATFAAARARRRLLEKRPAEEPSFEGQASVERAEAKRRFS
jgi:ArsR family transcriptional regulator